MEIKSEIIIQHPSKLVGQRIKALRRNRGLTGEGLGKLLNLSQQHISRIENGNVRLNVEQLNKISDILGVTLYSLLVDIGYQAKSLHLPFNCKTFFQASSLV